MDTTISDGLLCAILAVLRAPDGCSFERAFRENAALLLTEEAQQAVETAVHLRNGHEQSGPEVGRWLVDFIHKARLVGVDRAFRELENDQQELQSCVEQFVLARSRQEIQRLFAEKSSVLLRRQAVNALKSLIKSSENGADRLVLQDRLRLLENTMWLGFEAAVRRENCRAYLLRIANCESDDEATALIAAELSAFLEKTMPEVASDLLRTSEGETLERVKHASALVTRTLEQLLARR